MALPRPARFALFATFALTLASNEAFAQCGVENAELAPAGLMQNDQYGSALAADGEWAFVGAPGSLVSPQGTGTVYVYRWNGSTYVETQQLVSDSAQDNSFGHALDAAGGVLAVGEPRRSSDRGKVHLFALVGSLWQPVDELVSNVQAVGEQFGTSLALDPTGADQLIVGGLTESAEVFVRSGENWSFDEQLPFSGSNTWFGRTVDIHGDLALVGAERLNGFEGRAILYQDVGGTWTEIQRLQSQATQSSNFGRIVQLWAGRIAVSVGFPEGIELFVPQAGQWVHETTLSLPGEFGFGRRLNYDGNRIAVGSPVLGRSHVYELGSGGWSLMSTLISWDPNPLLGTVKTGHAVGLAGDRMLSGAPKNDFDTGTAFAYDLYAQQGSSYCTAGSSFNGCRANITATGTASATQASGFLLSACSVQADQNGLFYFGTGGRQANPWGNGDSFQCVVPPVKRAGMLPKTGKPGTCGGSFVQDLNALWAAAPSKNPGAGALVQAQLWYRDPFNTSNQTTSLSNAVEFQVAP